MQNYDLIWAYNIIRGDLTIEEKAALKTLTGMDDPETAVIHFFELLKGYKLLFETPYWELLSLEEKELISSKVFQWYNRVVILYPDFKDRCMYTYEDNLKLQIKVKGLKLVTKDDYVKHIRFLNEKIQEVINIDGSKKMIKWIKLELKNIEISIRLLSQFKEHPKFSIEGVNIDALVIELLSRNYFDKKYSEAVIDWFKGITPSKPIPMTIKANYFISIIGDLCDTRPKKILCTKNFLYTYISQSFLFGGERPKESYICKVLKPNNENRVSAFDKSIPDIKAFTTSI